MKQKVGVVTTKHNRYDVRIREKQITALSEYYDILFLVRDGFGDELLGNITTIDLCISQQTRFKTIKEYFRIFGVITQENLKSIHFHDPDFLFFLPILKLRKRVKVYYDVHEDLPRQILTKPYIKFPKVTSFLAEFVENILVRLFVDQVFCATPKIRERFSFKKGEVVANYPKIEYISGFKNTNRIKLTSRNLIYFGSISKTRGLDIILHIAGSDYIDKIILVGKFETINDYDKAISHPNWSKIEYYKATTQEHVFNLSKNALAGLCLLYPTKSYVDSLPVKLFEYMALGLPVIYSSFNYWQSLFPNNSIGLACDPMKRDSLILEIEKWIIDRQNLNEIGQNNISLVKNKYSWDSESKKLLSQYGKLF